MRQKDILLIESEIAFLESLERDIKGVEERRAWELEKRICLASNSKSIEHPCDAPFINITNINK